jgi:hypothetical protein
MNWFRALLTTTRNATHCLRPLSLREAMREVDPEGEGPELAQVGARAALLMIADKMLAQRFSGKVKNSKQFSVEADALDQWRRHHLPR